MNRKRLVMAFTGPSNSGKTTTIINLSNTLQDNGFKVCIVKHDPQDKAIFDTEGKDSHRFTQTNADVAVVSPNKTTIFKQSSSSISKVIDIFDEFDYLFIEGLKDLEDYPRIAIQREVLRSEYFPYIQAIACDETIDKNQIPSSISILDLNNISDLISWINKNARRV
jgi:molybdopterin-guanine dinucleotide biosynthesis protein B